MKRNDGMSSRHMIFLEKVFERRKILFKKGTNTNGNIHAKEEEWENIRQECVDAGYFELKDKSFRHLRDITWQNFRRRAVAKLDMVRKGGKDVEQLTDCDKLVLAIIGNIPIPSPILNTSSHHNHAPTQVVVEDEMGEEEPQVSGELFSIKTEPFDLLPMINGQSFASLFDSHSNTQSESTTDEQPIAIDTDRRPNLTTRRPLFEDDDEVADSPDSNQLGEESLAKKNTLKRKRQLADIRYRDAETEKLLAEADKMRAEAILIRLQATEIEMRLKEMNNQMNNQMNNRHEGKGATVYISDGQEL